MCWEKEVSQKKWEGGKKGECKDEYDQNVYDQNILYAYIKLSKNKNLFLKISYGIL